MKIQTFVCRLHFTSWQSLKCTECVYAPINYAKMSHFSLTRLLEWPRKEAKNFCLQTKKTLRTLLQIASKFNLTKIPFNLIDYLVLFLYVL